MSALTLYSTVNDGNTEGGVIDLQTKLLTYNIITTSQLRMVSDSALDVDQQYLVEGVSPNHLRLTETITLTGTTVVTSLYYYVKIERITKMAGSVLVGDVAISDSARTLATLEANLNGVEVTGLDTILYGIPGNPTKSKTYYEKFFIHNSGSSSISDLVISEYSDPDQDGTIAIDTTINGSMTSTSKTARPSGLNSNNFGLAKSVPTLAPGDYIGVWIRTAITAGTLISTKHYIVKLTYGAFEELAYLIARHANGQVLEEIVGLRSASKPYGGGIPTNYIELLNGKMVEELFYEPDPSTFRDQYYYNTRLNRMYKKLNTSPQPVWKYIR